MDKKLFNMFMWVADVRYIQDDKGQILLEEKPNLSFEYHSIRYFLTEQVYKTSENSEDIKLSEEQKNEIDEFIKQKREEVGLLKLAVDSTGKFIGLVRENDSRIANIVDSMPPTQDDWIWDFDTSKWITAYHYDNDGNFVYEKSGKSVGFTKKSYPFDLPLPHKFDVTKDSWIYVADETLSSKIRNKAMMDVIGTFLLTLVSVQNSPTKEKEILDYIANLLKNDDYIINIANEYSPNLHSHFSTAVTTISNEENDALNSYLESVDFKSYSTKRIGKVLYNASQETVADIVVEESLKANT